MSIKKLHDERKISNIIDIIKEIEGFDSDAKVATVLNLSPQNLNRLKKTENIPYDKLIHYCRDRGLDVEYLIFADKKNDVFLESFKTGASLNESSLEKRFINELNLDEEYFAFENIANLIIQSIPDHLNFSDLRYFHAQGDSLKPFIHEGSLLIVDVTDSKYETVQSGKIYVVKWAEELRAKELRKAPDGSLEVWRRYPKWELEYHIHKDDLANVKILGRVVYVGRAI